MGVTWKKHDWVVAFIVAATFCLACPGAEAARRGQAHFDANVMEQTMALYDNPAKLMKTLELQTPDSHTFDNSHPEIFGKKSQRARQAKARQKFLSETYQFHNHPKALSEPMILQPDQGFAHRVKNFFARHLSRPAKEAVEETVADEWNIRIDDGAAE